jgi:hypothetical protein
MERVWQGFLATRLRPLRLKPTLVGFGRTAYRRRSENTSTVLGQLFAKMQGEGFAMSYTMEDSKRDVRKKIFLQLTPEEQQEFLLSLPLEERLAGLSAEQIREYLERLTAGRPAETRKPRRKK